MAKLYFLRPTQESNTWSTTQLLLVYRVGMLLQKCHRLLDNSVPFVWFPNFFASFIRDKSLFCVEKF